MNPKTKIEQIDSHLPDNNPLPQEHNVRERFSALVFHNQEYQHSHNSYMAEVREMDCIERGDIEMLERCWKSGSPGNSFGILAKDWIRNVKNLCIAVITLASRAAIRGGVHPEEAFSLCDCYVQALEDCQDTNVLGQLALRAERHFAEMVRDLRNNSLKTVSTKGDPHINRCKDYIFAHLHETLTVQQIADVLYLNPNYLSDLFKKYEGRSILNYILHEKVKLVQNMLTYSQYTYSEIASYLGFSSQSHLGMQFKKVTGMTLREYRVKYQVS